MKKIFVIICLFLISVLVYSENFTYKYNQGEKYKIVSIADENIYLDGIFHHKARILNKISVEVLKTYDDGSGEIEANYSTSEERSGNIQVYALAQEYFSTFRRDKTGRISIDPSYFMPVVRNVPLFDGRDYSPGDTWEMEGYEVHDLRAGYGIEEAFSFPIKVQYKYLGKGEKDGNEYDIISIFYSISERSSEYYSRYPLYPVKITGYSDQTLFWDNAAGRPYAYEEEFSIQFSLSNGTIHEFSGTAQAKVTESELMDKNLIAKNIEERLDKERLENAIVDIDENGVTITLGSINFGADSSKLTFPEKKKLDVIIDILKNYPDRDILITGHTALAGTAGGRLELSRQRASMVAEYFFSEGAKKRDQLLIIGKGATNPVADNTTAEGMTLNRRVEITIVEN
ncbi:MAG: OmpA family protein [Spirochaetota bacterium]|nr:OmpA family protein [Spirochaetota bacterium]